MMAWMHDCMKVRFNFSAVHFIQYPESSIQHQPLMS